MKAKLTPYQRIVKAAKAGRGVRLSADEAYDLGEMDEAIYARAALDDDEQAEAKTAARQQKQEAGR